MFRDVDGRQRARRLEARSERKAIAEARAILAARDGGERIVGAGLTLDELVERDYWPLLESLAAAGLRSERNVDDERDCYRLHVQPRPGTMLLGDVEPRALAELIAAMRARKPKPYAEATVDNVLGVVRGHVDPVEAAQLTGHSLAVWARHYARSFGKAQRDEARARLLEHGFGAVDDDVDEAVEAEVR